MTRQILIVHPSRLRGENHGIYVQHVASLQWLLTEQNGWRVIALDPYHPAFPEAALCSDIVIVHMLPHGEIEAMIRLRREQSLPTVFEFSDNFLGLGEWLPKNHGLRSPLVRQRLLYHATLCDAVQVYASGLRDLFARVNPRVALFDPYVPIPEAAPGKPAGFVFGWGGTTSHEQDLHRAAPAIVEFCARHEDVTFAYMGDEAMFRRHFAALPPARTMMAPFGPFATYLDFVRRLHVGIAPATPSPFTAGRTDTKPLIYASSRVAAILQDVEPYRAHAGHALLFGNPDELLTALEGLYADRALMTNLAARALAWAREQRGAVRLAAQRDDFYRGLLRAEAVKSPPIGAAIAADELLDLGTLRPEEALATARGIADAHPAYAQARWAMVSALDALGRREELLAELKGFDWPLLYADGVAELRARAMLAICPAEAGKQIDTIRSPLTRLRLRAQGDRDRGAFFQAVVREQPYDFFALSAVIRTLQREDPCSPELDALYERLCLLAPADVPSHRRPSSLTPFLPA